MSVNTPLQMVSLSPSDASALAAVVADRILSKVVDALVQAQGTSAGGGIVAQMRPSGGGGGSYQCGPNGFTCGDYQCQTTHGCEGRFDCTVKFAG